MSKSFIKTALPTLVNGLEAWRGPIGFNQNLLERSGDKIAAFHGYDCCRQASQIMAWMLQKNGFKNFRIVSDLTKIRHTFLHDVTSSPDDPILLDPTVRQFFSYAAIDGILNTLADSEDEKLAEEVFRYAASPRRNIEAVIQFENFLSKEIDPIFLGTKTELESQISNIFDRHEAAFHFGQVLSSEILKTTLACWDGSAETWQTVPLTLDRKVTDFLSQPDKPPSTIGGILEVKAIQVMLKEMEKGDNSKTR